MRIYSSYITKLNSKIKRKLSKPKLTNNDLHDLFYLYDNLDYYSYYENESYYRNKILEWKEELDNE